MNKKLKQLELNSKERREQMKNFIFTEKDKIANENFNDLENEAYSNIEESFKQIGEYKQGERKFKSLKESQELWDEWTRKVEEYIEDVNNGKVTSQESLNSLIGAGICEENGDLSEPYKPLMLEQIREKNRADTTLLGSEIEPQEYSEELVNQCKEEFETFVKPIRDDVVERYCTVTESLEQSLKEMQLMRQGKLPKKTINEVLEELDNE